MRSGRGVLELPKDGILRAGDKGWGLRPGTMVVDRAEERRDSNLL
jgi:hypothetical protein